MSSIVIRFPEPRITAQSLVSHPVHRRARVLAQVEGMRARGMSDTGIRRALGLSEQQAVEAGIIPARLDSLSDGATPAPKAVGHGPKDQAGSRDGTVRGLEISGCGPGSSGRGPLMAEVLAAVARSGGVDRAEIMGPSQGRHLTPLRQLTMYLLREVCVGASLPAIGHFLGRDHTTVHYGCRKAAQRLRTDPDFHRLYDAIRCEWTPSEGPAGG